MGNTMQKSLILMFSLIVSSALGQVTISPEELVVAEGGDTAFTCVSPSSTETHEWLINGTSLNDGHRRDGVTQERDIVLRFRNASTEYNNTRIQCRAGSGVSSAVLLVQGKLAAVRSLVAIHGFDNITVRWTAPFTLDIPLVEPDISGYCVCVVSSTTSATLHSECGITETEFTYPLPPRSWCHEYNITVMPVNFAGNGTAKSVFFYQELPGPELLEVELYNTTYVLFMSAPVCQAEVTLLDIDAGESIFMGDTELILAWITISFDSQLLTENRKYRVKVQSSNIGGNATSETTLSTHDITYSSVFQAENNTFVLVNFTEHSEATGALLSFIFIDEDSVTADFRKSFNLVVDRNDVSQGLVHPLNMYYPGQYMLYAYDIESNKRIRDGLQYQASNCSFRVNGSAEIIPSPLSLECMITSHERIITVVFPFSRFQVTAQRNTLDSVNILHVNTSMDPQTPVTLQVTENGEYLVTILPVQDERGILTFSQILAVTDVQTTQGPISSTPPISTNMTNVPSKTEFTILGLIGGLVCLSLLSAVLAVVVAIQCCKQSSKVKVQLNQPPAEVGGVLSPDGETAETQMYEEIKEPASAPSTQRTASPAPRVPPPALVPQYEDVEISAASNTKHSYQITTCAAYGVSL